MTATQFKSGAAWIVGALTVFSALVGTSVAAADALFLTREDSDAIYETKEAAELRLRIVQEQLRSMDEKLDEIRARQ